MAANIAFYMWDSCHLDKTVVGFVIVIMGNSNVIHLHIETATNKSKLRKCTFFQNCVFAFVNIYLDSVYFYSGPMDLCRFLAFRYILNNVNNWLDKIRTQLKQWWYSVKSVSLYFRSFLICYAIYIQTKILNMYLNKYWRNLTYVFQFTS